MKKLFIIYDIKVTCNFGLYIFLMCTFNLVAQQTPSINNFKIGVFGGSQIKTQNNSGCVTPVTWVTDVNGDKTSIFNVLSNDGFNIYQCYTPNEWHSFDFVKNYLSLANANGLKVEVSFKEFYKPAVDASNNYLGYGTNEYGNCGIILPSCDNPFNNNQFRPNYNEFISTIGSQSPYKDIIWGYHITEEASYEHSYNFSNNCSGNQWGNPSYFKNVELPPTNVISAIDHFKTSLQGYNINNKKMVVMEANHGQNINANTIDYQGVYNPQQYIQLLNPNDKRDVYFEGSYTQFPSTAWINQIYGDELIGSGMFSTSNFHYLGGIKSIDYAKKYSSEVHKIITLEDYQYPQGKNHYHSNLNIMNGNWLWFQAYTSIIHGAKGIWFWGLDEAWENSEITNGSNTIWGGVLPNRYEKTYFPNNYKNFASHLANELRFLVNKNIISTDPQTIVCSKTDSEDPNCIVPPSSNYIPSFLPDEKKSEKYGLRYTIRTNGSETWMIISNPLNIALTDVNLNFSSSTNQIIQNSSGVEIYFDNNSNPVTDGQYKINRNSNIDLINSTVVNKHSINFNGNKQLLLSFGPLDVKVIKFNGTNTHYNNSWANVWSNFGCGTIDGHTVNNPDRFYIGDFDGGGDEELLCVQNTNGNGDWITILKYDSLNSKWLWIWSNYGNSASGNGIYPYRKNFVVGDYDGDGKDELLGNDLTPGGWTTLFKFVNGNWQWSWSDYGNSSHALRPYKDKLYAGDFNGDGKDDVLGCCLLYGGWSTIFEWNGNDFVWGYWSDFGNQNHPLYPYRTNLLLGDYDGDNKTDVLGFNSWSTYFTFGPYDWNWTWSTNGSNSFSGWSYPLSVGDVVLSGNIDNDAKDELMFLQNSQNAAWATTMDLFFKKGNYSFKWNWSGNPTSPNVPFIDDWSITPPSGANDTRYYFIKAKATEPKYLLAMRHQGCGYLVNMYKTSNPASNYKTILGGASDANKILTNDNSISIYPNPAKDEVTVKFTEKNLDNTITIMDIQGKVVLKLVNQNNQEVKIDTRTFKQGVYFVKVKNNINFTAYKLIIE